LKSIFRYIPIWDGRLANRIMIKKSVLNLLWIPKHYWAFSEENGIKKSVIKSY